MMAGATILLDQLRTRFGEQVQQDAPLARYTAARVGGVADLLVVVNTAAELVAAVEILWAQDAPYFLLGGGSNILVSDNGVRGVVVLNKARQVRFDVEQTVVWAESGANLGALARQAAGKGLGGIEWAASIPGTLGGAVFGNAGAHDGDVAGSLIEAELYVDGRGRQIWSVADFAYEYRSSILKRAPRRAIILSATVQLERREPDAIQEKMHRFLQHRKTTQPPGASMGSMFKNPPADYAGRLIEAAGLKGTRLGNVEISSQHANFFINHGDATAQDVRALIELARTTVAAQHGIDLKLEIELVGDWDSPQLIQNTEMRR